jgi:multidrug resistance efflux pump
MSHLKDVPNHSQLAAARLINTPRFTRLLAYWLGGMFVFFILCLFMPWTQNITMNGRVTNYLPQERPQEIQTIIGGRITKWFIREGQEVRKGDTILAIAEVKEKFLDPDMLNRMQHQIDAKEGVLETNRQKAEALSRQIQALRQGLQVSLGKARNKVIQSKFKLQSDSMDLTAAMVDFQIAQTRYDRDVELFKQGLKSAVDVETRRLNLQNAGAKKLSAQNKYATSQNELSNAYLELSSLEAEYLDKISKAESEYSSTLSYAFATEGELIKMNNEFTSLEIRNSYYFVVAPQDGYVVKALKSGVGETIKDGEAVATIAALHVQKAVEMYIKPMDLPLVHVGNHVRIQFDGWPALAFSGWPNMSFGTFGGTIKAVDRIDTKGKYRLLIVPYDHDGKHPWPNAIQVGSGCYGWALLKDVSIWYEMWRQLNGFPPDFIEGNIPQTNAEKKRSDDQYTPLPDKEIKREE